MFSFNFGWGWCVTIKNMLVHVCSSKLWLAEQALYRHVWIRKWFRDPIHEGQRAKCNQSSIRHHNVAVKKN